MQHSEPQKSIGSRPSLLSPSEPSKTESERILTRLPGQSGPAIPAPLGLWKMRFPVIVLGTLGTVATWFIYVDPDSMTRTLQVATVFRGDVTKPIVTAHRTPPVTPETPKTPKTPVTLQNLRAESHAATIISDDAGRGDKVDSKKMPVANGQSKLAAALEAGVTARPNTLRSALEAGAPAKHRASNSTFSKPHESHLPVVSKILKKPVVVVARKSRPVSDPVARQMDGDVSLISALVSHATEHDQNQKGSHPSSQDTFLPAKR